MLTIIIPTLNEAAALPKLLDSLAAQTDISFDILVVDGGSGDPTRQLCDQRGVSVLETQASRALQMNAGAMQVDTDYLFFVHADCQLTNPKQLAHGLKKLREEKRQNPGIIAGHFALKFDLDESEKPVDLTYMEAKSASNRRYTINGDQGLLIAREDFLKLGGFDESLPYFEDQKLADRIFLNGKWVLLDGKMQTSARRFVAEGTRRRYLLMMLMMAMHYGDVPEFFSEAKSLYRAQSDAQKLPIADYVRLVRKLVTERDDTLKILYRFGRFTREAAWQPLLMLDLKYQTHFFTRLHDRVLRYLIANPIGNLISMGLVSAWYFVCLPRALKHSGVWYE